MNQSSVRAWGHVALVCFRLWCCVVKQLRMHEFRFNAVLKLNLLLPARGKGHESSCIVPDLNAIYCKFLTFRQRRSLFLLLSTNSSVQPFPVDCWGCRTRSRCGESVLNKHSRCQKQMSGQIQFLTPQQRCRRLRNRKNLCGHLFSLDGLFILETGVVHCWCEIRM